MMPESAPAIVETDRGRIQAVRDGEATTQRDKKPNSGTQIVSVGFSGPIPPPGILAGYNEVSPGLGDKIVAMADKEQNHRHNMDDRSMTADIHMAYLGIASGLLIGVIAVVGSVVMVVSGNPVSGTIFGATGIAGLVGVFIAGTKRNNRAIEDEDDDDGEERDQ